MAQTSYDSIKRDLEHLRADVAHITDSLRSLGVEEGDGAIRRMREAIGSASHTARRAAAGTVHQIEERPLVSVAGALGAGILIGALLTRRS